MENPENGLNDLVAVSREFGADPKWVVAGGGNTSWKSDEVLYVKASGFPLATIGADGFARMDRRRLAAVWSKDYPSGDDAASVAERERLVLADMMAARVPGEERRPSVETLLHDILPWQLVVHLHPTLVNGLTCGTHGRKTAEELFGDAQLWIPVTDPGYVLAKRIRDALVQYRERTSKDPDYIFLANHGVFAGGSGAPEVSRRYADLESTLRGRLVRTCGRMPETQVLPRELERLQRLLTGAFGPDSSAVFLSGGELEGYLDTAESARPLTGCLTPDHIVYAGPGALYLGPRAFETPGSGASEAKLASEIDAYRTRWGKPPLVTLINDGRRLRGALVTASHVRTRDNAVLLLENALEVCAYSDSFGGPLLMEERFVRFIVDWEVENYRSAVAAG